MEKFYDKFVRNMRLCFAVAILQHNDQETQRVIRF